MVFLVPCWRVCVKYTLLATDTRFVKTGNWLVSVPFVYRQFVGGSEVEIEFHYYHNKSAAKLPDRSVLASLILYLQVISLRVFIIYRWIQNNIVCYHSECDSTAYGGHEVYPSSFFVPYNGLEVAFRRWQFISCRISLSLPYCA